ncbi:MAG: DUF1499 domain-containing protein [Pseudomonadota bacterium]
MNITALSLIVISLFLLLTASCAGQLSKQKKAPGTADERLQSCPDKPNCINTEYPDRISQYMPALDYPKQKEEQVMVIAKDIIVKMGGQIIAEESHYLAATFTSSFFRFVDDFEIRRNETSTKLHIRSASRVGYSDFGVNKQRVEKFSDNFKAKIY